MSGGPLRSDTREGSSAQRWTRPRAQDSPRFHAVPLPSGAPSGDLQGFLGRPLFLGSLPLTPNALASLDPQLHLLDSGTLLGPC